MFELVTFKSKVWRVSLTKNHFWFGCLKFIHCEKATEFKKNLVLMFQVMLKNWKIFFQILWHSHSELQTTFSFQQTKFQIFD